MKNYFSPTNWYSSVYFRWTVFPILAHVLSWMTGIMGYLLFPILVTIAQYLIFKSHPAVNRAGAWFFTLPITFFIWLKWGPATPAHSILSGVIAYYAGQLLNTLFIPLIVRPEHWVIILNWLCSTIIAGIVWVILYKTLVFMVPDWNDLRRSSYSAVLTVYPMIALLANGISSVCWRKDLYSV